MTREERIAEIAKPRRRREMVRTDYMAKQAARITALESQLTEAKGHVRAFVGIKVRHGQLSIDHDKISADIAAAQAWLNGMEG